MNPATNPVPAIATRPFNIWPEHSSGKWIVSRTNLGTNQEQVFAECWTQEDARLIAAAPDLLAALVELTEQHDAMLATFPNGFGWGRLISDKARAAIARATT